MPTQPMLTQVRAVLMDLDGVVFRGDAPLSGATTALPRLRRLGVSYAFVTNNATLTPEQVASKLNAMGVAARPEDIVTSSAATATYLRSVAHPEATVSIIGEEGLVQALVREGFEIDEENPTYVVVGLDRHVTYERLARAAIAIQRGAELIATNADPALPVEHGLWPGAGAILSMLVLPTGAKPTIIGKPEPAILHVALGRLGVPPSQAAMVGDQIRSDIRAGRAAGTFTILVAGDLADADGEIRPDLVVSSLDEAITLLERAQLSSRGAEPISAQQPWPLDPGRQP